MVVAVGLRGEGAPGLGRVAGVALHHAIGAAGGGELVGVGVAEGGWKERVVCMAALVEYSPSELGPLGK